MIHTRALVMGGLVLGIAGCGNSVGTPSVISAPAGRAAGAPAAYSENMLWQFSSYPTDGAEPYAGVIADSSGNLHGTTRSGGQPPAPYLGTVYELSSSGNSWSESVLHTFHGPDGYYPYAPVIFASGNLYGTTTAGGTTYGSGCNTNGCGTVFELTHGTSGWSESVLNSFTNGSDGGQPFGPTCSIKVETSTVRPKLAAIRHALPLSAPAAASCSN